MDFIIGVVVGLVFGANLGFMIAALLQMSRVNDHGGSDNETED